MVGYLYRPSAFYRKFSDNMTYDEICVCSELPSKKRFIANVKIRAGESLWYVLMNTYPCNFQFIYSLEQKTHSKSK